MNLIEVVKALEVSVRSLSVRCDSAETILGKLLTDMCDNKKDMKQQDKRILSVITTNNACTDTVSKLAQRIQTLEDVKEGIKVKFKNINQTLNALGSRTKLLDILVKRHAVELHNLDDCYRDMDEALKSNDKRMVELYVGIEDALAQLHVATAVSLTHEESVDKVVSELNEKIVNLSNMHNNTVDGLALITENFQKLKHRFDELHPDTDTNGCDNFMVYLPLTQEEIEILLNSLTKGPQYIIKESLIKEQLEMALAKLEEKKNDR